jgi:hypothetical protein
MTPDSGSRATRSKRELRLLVLLAATLAIGITVLRAQETPQAPPEPGPSTGQTDAAGPAASESPPTPDPTAPAAAPAATDPPAAPPPASGDEDEPPSDAAPRTQGTVGPTPGHFEPSEKVRADFDVSFPVDI